MGYILNENIEVKEPDVVTLSGASNFITFKSKKSIELNFHAEIEVKLASGGSYGSLDSILKITSPTGEHEYFYGSTVMIGGGDFYISNNFAETAESIRHALLSREWISSKYDVTIPAKEVAGVLTAGNVIHIRSYGTSSLLNLTITGDSKDYEIKIISTANNPDAILEGKESAEIELDVYRETSGSIGKAQKPHDSHNTKMVSLQKTYIGNPLWFNLGGIMGVEPSAYPPPQRAYWADLFFAFFSIKANIINNNIKAIYYLDNICVIKRGSGDSERIDMKPYVLNVTDKKVKLLTNRPLTTIVEGQKEYINFLLSAKNAENVKKDISVYYKVLDALGNKIYENTLHTLQYPTNRSAVTHLLNTDTFIKKDNAHTLRIALKYDDKVVSNFIEYEILPKCLHTLHQFTFLNKLGGWDGYNFEGKLKSDSKVKTDTYHRTLTPTIIGATELTHKAEYNTTYTIEGVAVTDAVAEWLQELAESKRVFIDGNKPIIIEEFSLKCSPDSMNMQRPTIKYRLAK